MMNRDHLTRRMFAAHAASITAGVSLAGLDRSAGTGAMQDVTPPIRIRGIELQTSQPIAVMKDFYGSTIGLPVVSENESSITFGAGTSTLKFQHAPGLEAFYHFAFNIPENQIVSAHAWQQERTDFIVPPSRLNDPGLPREVVAFRNWNAHSVFFWDPAGNAVEYIARHDLKNAEPGTFSIKNILRLSEIGLIANDVPAAARAVRDVLRVPNYSSRSEAFEALGDPHGLLLFFKRGGAMAFEQGGAREVFPTTVHLMPGPSGDEFPARPSRLIVEGYPYVLMSETL